MTGAMLHWLELNTARLWTRKYFIVGWPGVELNLLWLLAADLFNGVGVSLDKGNHLHSQNTGFESVTCVIAAFNPSTTGLAVSDCIALVAFHGSSHGFT